MDDYSYIDGLKPGDRVRAYRVGYREWPGEFKEGTIRARYGNLSRWMIKEYGHPEAGRYPDLCDVEFDCEPGRISRGHFTECIRLLESSKAAL